MIQPGKNRMQFVNQIQNAICGLATGKKPWTNQQISEITSVCNFFLVHIIATLFMLFNGECLTKKSGQFLWMVILYYPKEIAPCVYTQTFLFSNFDSSFCLQRSKILLPLGMSLPVWAERFWRFDTRFYRSCTHCFMRLTHWDQLWCAPLCTSE